MKALISPNEVWTHMWISSWEEVEGITQPVHSTLEYTRVAQVEEDQNIFEVAEPLHWVDIPDSITTYTNLGYIDQQVVALPESVENV